MRFRVSNITYGKQTMLLVAEMGWDGLDISVPDSRVLKKDKEMTIFAGAPVSKGLILSWISIFAIEEMGGGKIIVSREEFGRNYPK